MPWMKESVGVTWPLLLALSPALPLRCSSQSFCDKGVTGVLPLKADVTPGAKLSG